MRNDNPSAVFAEVLFLLMTDPAAGLHTQMRYKLSYSSYFPNLIPSLFTLYLLLLPQRFRFASSLLYSFSFYSFLALPFNSFSVSSLMIERFSKFRVGEKFHDISPQKLYPRTLD